MADEHSYTFTLYADHYQFYLGDSVFVADTGGDFWNEAALVRHLAIDPPGLVGVGTSFYGDVPVVVEVYSDAPSDDTAGWDRVIEASLAVPSGLVAIDGCLSYMPDGAYRQALERHPDAVAHIARSPHIPVAPGTYRVRIHAGATGTERFVTTPDGECEITDEHYRVILWPAPYAEPMVLHMAG